MCFKTLTFWNLSIHLNPEIGSNMDTFFFFIPLWYQSKLNRSLTIWTQISIVFWLVLGILPPFSGTTESGFVGHKAHTHTPLFVIMFAKALASWLLSWDVSILQHNVLSWWCHQLCEIYKSLSAAKHYVHYAVTPALHNWHGAGFPYIKRLGSIWELTTEVHISSLSSDTNKNQTSGNVSVHKTKFDVIHSGLCLATSIF